MDTAVPVISCDETGNDYPLTAMSLVFILTFNLIPLQYLRVKAPCGHWHALPPHEMVDEALALGFHLQPPEEPSVLDVHEYELSYGYQLGHDTTDWPITEADARRVRGFGRGLEVRLDDILHEGHLEGPDEALVATFASQLGQMNRVVQYLPTT